MITSSLFALALLSGNAQAEAAAVPEVLFRAEIFAAEQPGRRDTAAERIEGALDGSTTLGALLDAADDARALLLDGEMKRRLDRVVADARWSALLDADVALRTLSGDLAAIASDLAFTPYVEAELPEGFPVPTMVGEIELRSYPRYRMATTPMDGGRNNGAFWKLFQHITSNDIPMTAPVETTFEVDEDGMRATTMAFLYEGPKQGTAGNAGAVDVIDAEPELVVSMGLRGSDRRGRVDAAHARLLEWIAARPELEVAGDMRTMGYNSPMVRGSRRTFEVQVPVRPTVGTDADGEARDV